MSDKYTVTLSSSLDGGETPHQIILSRPTVGALRGLQLATLQMQDVNALIKLLPRITTPLLTPDQVANLPAHDFAQLANHVSLFFLSPIEAAAAMRTETEAI